jgi:hypothetical protein
MASVAQPTSISSCFKEGRIFKQQQLAASFAAPPLADKPAPPEN